MIKKVENVLKDIEQREIISWFKSEENTEFTYVVIVNDSKVAHQIASEMRLRRDQYKYLVTESQIVGRSLPSQELWFIHESLLESSCRLHWRFKKIFDCDFNQIEPTV